MNINERNQPPIEDKLSKERNVLNALLEKCIKIHKNVLKRNTSKK
jgi:hypothetical protein